STGTMTADTHRPAGAACQASRTAPRAPAWMAKARRASAPRRRAAGPRPPVARTSGPTGPAALTGRRPRSRPVPRQRAVLAQHRGPHLVVKQPEEVVPQVMERRGRHEVRGARVTGGG